MAELPCGEFSEFKVSRQCDVVVAIVFVSVGGATADESTGRPNYLQTQH